MSEKMWNIMQRVKKRRKELNLSYKDLSERTGISRGTLEKYESGLIKNVPIGKFQLLADGLEIKPYELMGWDGEYLLSQKQKDEEHADIVDLHNVFLKLNETGRRNVLRYMSDILSIDKYRQK